MYRFTLGVLFLCGANVLAQSASALTDCNSTSRFLGSESWTACSKAADVADTDDHVKRASGPSPDLSNILDKISNAKPSSSAPKTVADDDLVPAIKLIANKDATLRSMYRAFVAMKKNHIESKPTFSSRLAPFARRSRNTRNLKAEMKLKADFSSAFRITKPEATAIFEWGRNHVISKDLQPGIEQIPDYKGLALRQTRLTHEHLQMLVELKPGHLGIPGTYDVSDLVINRFSGRNKFQRSPISTGPDGYPRAVLSAEPGITLSQWEFKVSPEPHYFLVFMSKHGKYGTPVYPGKQEILWMSGKFQVLGYLKEGMKGNPLAIFLEELE